MKNLFIALILSVIVSMTTADPCRRNNGGCDFQHGLCWSTEPNNHYCTCKAGFREPAFSFRHSCVDVNECADTNVCGENAHCENTIGSFRCVCKCGYILDYTSTRCLEAAQITDQCIIPSRCTHRTSPSVPPVTFDVRNSQNYITSYDRFRYRFINQGFSSCSGCEVGFQFNACGFCDDVNECFIGNPCSGSNIRCVNTEGSYYCACSAGYTLGPCGKRCYGSGETVPELCSPSNLDALRTAGLNFRTFVTPIVLEDYRTCGQGRREGQTTTQQFNIDSNFATDITLQWVCSTGTSGQRLSVLKSYSEGEASWDPWTCWTVCKATCWGGLQTRSRICRNGLPGVGRCSGPGSQKRSCYNGKRCPYRIRRDVASLTPTQRNDLIQAMRRYKQDLTATGFHNAAAAHGWPFLCDRGPCCPHGAKVEFLSWHRTMMLYFEKGLSRYLNDTQLGIPYWNWLALNKDPPSLAWQRWINGQENPFANMTVRRDRSGSMTTIQRDSTVFRDGLQFADNSWRNIALRKIGPHIWHEFAESVESGHGGPHVSTCGNGRTTPKCAISFAQLNYAAYDPLFMFHHCQVDRQWAIAQKKLADQGNTTWTVQSAVEMLNSPSTFGRVQMPYGNSSINPFACVLANANRRNSYYPEELSGVKYDSLENDGYPMASRRALRLGGLAALFIAHYFQSDTRNFYVNYYNDNGRPCNQMPVSRRLGGVLRLGTSRAYRSTVPHLTSITNLARGVLDSDITLKVCYTRNPNCRERCPEIFGRERINTMPSPNLVYYFPNAPVDVYKFRWDVGQRMPNWYINLDAKTQYIFFYGNRAANIRQVRTYSQYQNCNSFGGRPIRCRFYRQGNREAGGACILPSGVYFLVDSDANRCRQGLKLIVVSRITKT